VCTWLHFVLVALHSRLVCVYRHPGTNTKRSQVAFVVWVRSIVLSLGHLGGKIVGASRAAQSLRETCSKNWILESALHLSPGIRYRASISLNLDIFWMGFWLVFTKQPKNCLFFELFWAVQFQNVELFSHVAQYGTAPSKCCTCTKIWVLIQGYRVRGSSFIFYAHSVQVIP